MKRLLLLSIIFGINHILLGQCDDTLPITETFDDSNVINVCWDTNDQDGDTYSWSYWEFSEYYGGHKVIASYSMSGLTPDNWLISHAIDLTSYAPGDNIILNWKIRGELSYAAHEYYTVYAATGNQISNFTSSPIQRSEYTDEVGGAGVFVNREIDISSLAGNTIYIAFRHHNTTNQGAINIDELSLAASGSLGTEDVNSNDLKHYYNKESGVLTLKSPNNPINNIQIFNILGSRVLSKKLSNTVETLNLSTLKDGLYIAHVEFEGSDYTMKFIKH